MTPPPESQRAEGAHTALPWVVVEPVALDWRDPLIYGANGQSLIALTQGGGPGRAIDGPEQRANAALIVRSVNNFESLLGALEAVVGLNHEKRRMVKEYPAGTCNAEDAWSEFDATQKAAWDQARAALAKAKAQP